MTDRKTTLSCINAVLERITVIETKLDMHIKAEERDRAEFRWTGRLVLVTMVSTIGYLLTIGVPWA
jgi:hypothetical protein